MPKRWGIVSSIFLGRDQSLTTFAAAAGTAELTLPDATPAFATVRISAPGTAKLAVVDRREDALMAWRSDLALTVYPLRHHRLRVLILGFAFHWQAIRAREADLIYDTVRTRIDTALNRGRCGLWDWDLARGHIFWSHSMFAILGLPAKDDLLSFGRSSPASTPRTCSSTSSPANCRSQGRIDRSRLPACATPNGKWVWLRARCELAQQAGEPGTAPDRIAVDVTEQKSLVERTAEADLAAARRHRDDPGSLRGLGCAESTGAVQFEFPRTCTTCPTPRSKPAPPTNR